MVVRSRARSAFWSRMADWSEAWCAARVVAIVDWSASICLRISLRAREVVAEWAERDDRDDVLEWCVILERRDRVERIELVVLICAG